VKSDARWIKPGSWSAMYGSIVSILLGFYSVVR
jgi:hypothetical protein